MSRGSSKRRLSLRHVRFSPYVVPRRLLTLFLLAGRRGKCPEERYGSSTPRRTTNVFFEMFNSLIKGCVGTKSSTPRLLEMPRQVLEHSSQIPEGHLPKLGLIPMDVAIGYGFSWRQAERTIFWHPSKSIDRYYTSSKVQASTFLLTTNLHISRYDQYALFVFLACQQPDCQQILLGLGC